MSASKVVSYGKLPDTDEGWQRIWVQLENGFAFILSVDEGTDHPRYQFTQKVEMGGTEIMASWKEAPDSNHTTDWKPRMRIVNLYGSRKAYEAFAKEIWPE